MPGLATIPIARRTDLVVRALGDGRHVVKDPHTGAFYHLGEEEYFLLERLDGRQTALELCTAFAERFGQQLVPDELDEFVEMARSQGLLQAAGESPPAAGNDRPRQSLLAWRRSLFDPDRLFTRLTPRLSFLWTRTFLVVSAVAVGLAGVLAWANRRELLASAAGGLRWQTLALVWL